MGISRPAAAVRSNDEYIPPPPNPFEEPQLVEQSNNAAQPENPADLSPDSQISPDVSLSYWSSISADVDGMLGGFPQVSRVDLQGSRNFIYKVRRLLYSHAPDANRTKFPLAVDCGAGIGRITEGMLLDLCDVVDIVEPVEKFARTLEAKHRTPPQANSPKGRLGEIFVTPLEKWKPPASKHKAYSLIWNQWCLGHLPDATLTNYLRYTATELLDLSDPASFIMVKENLSSDAFGEDIFDEVDSSVTRSDSKFRQIFQNAGLEVVRMEVQAGMPRGLYPVKMYALRPKREGES